jgi:hypothetical protein
MFALASQAILSTPICLTACYSPLFLNLELKSTALPPLPLSHYSFSTYDHRSPKTCSCLNLEFDAIVTINVIITFGSARWSGWYARDIT